MSIFGEGGYTPEDMGLSDKDKEAMGLEPEKTEEAIKKEERDEIEGKAAGDELKGESDKNVRRTEKGPLGRIKKFTKERREIKEGEEILDKEDEEKREKEKGEALEEMKSLFKKIDDELTEAKYEPKKWDSAGYGHHDLRDLAKKHGLEKEGLELLHSLLNFLNKGKGIYTDEYEEQRNKWRRKFNLDIEDLKDSLKDKKR